MMRLFINSLAAQTGGGLTYIRNVLPYLVLDPDVSVTVALSPELKAEFSGLCGVDFLDLDVPPARRFWYEQYILPGVLRSCRSDVLLSTGNVALRRSPVPQILLSRNSIYTSADYYRDLLSRHEYGAWFNTRLRAMFAKRSVSWADITVAPSEAFAIELRRWTGARIVTIHHGFDHEAFTRDGSALSSEVVQKLGGLKDSFKLLFVSHYNYYRNFETLIRALPLLRGALPSGGIKVLLTCELLARRNPGAYRPEAAAKLVEQFGVSDMLIELGAIPYRQLHLLYTHADAYITPAYTETFAHPLVESMDSGLPVVASDIPVHREICQESAVYFPRFSAEALANAVVKLATSPDTAKRMAATGKHRAGMFSWKTHVEKIIELSRRLLDSASRGLPSG